MKRVQLLLAAMLLCPIAVWSFETKGSVTVTPLLKTSTSWDGVPISYPTGQAEITGIMIEIAPGGETGWHSHPVPSFGMILEGRLAVTLKDGRVKEIQAGEALAEVIGTIHNGRVIGDRPVKLIVFYAGAAGTVLSVPATNEK